MIFTLLDLIKKLCVKQSVQECLLEMVG